MRVVIQRVKYASVTINNRISAQVGQGLMILLGIEAEDKEEDADWLAGKIINQRIFSDSEQKMNLSLLDVKGSILLISQFTLHASTKKGNRPSFIKAARPEQAIPLYEYVRKKMEELLGKDIETGEFGADMKVELLNDGPVTIVMDSKNRE